VNNLDEMRAELATLRDYAAQAWRAAPHNYISASVHIFADSIHVDVGGYADGLHRRASGKAETFDEAAAQCREEIAQSDPVLLARTLGIEDAA
jgi:hypothetical protein